MAFASYLLNYGRNHYECSMLRLLELMIATGDGGTSFCLVAPTNAVPIATVALKI